MIVAGAGPAVIVVAPKRARAGTRVVMLDAALLPGWMERRPGL